MAIEQVKEAYIAYWRNFKDFSGKTSRYDYLVVILVNLLIGIALSIVTSVLVVLRIPFIWMILSLVYSLYSLANLVPGIAICIRRFRDVGKEWHWVLFLLIPLYNFYVIYILLQPSIDGESKDKTTNKTPEDRKKMKSTKGKSSSSKKTRNKKSSSTSKKKSSSTRKKKSRRSSAEE